jgi:predicted ATPase
MPTRRTEGENRITPARFRVVRPRTENHLWHDTPVYLSALRRRRSNDQGFPWNVPVVAALDSLEFDTPVTFFVGENGSGKSTVLEGFAAGMRAIAVGSADIDNDETLRAARRFASGFRFERRRHPRTKLFFRAEDVFGFTRPVLRTMRDLSEIEEAFRREPTATSAFKKRMKRLANP